MANQTPNLQGIVEHRAKKKNDAFQRVCRVIEQKLRSHALITIKSVADEARVSRTYIYRNTELKDKIEGVKKTSEVRYSTSLIDAKIKARTKNLQNQLQAVGEKYKGLQNTHDALQKENNSLKSYIEELTEQLNQYRQQPRIVR